MSRQIEANLLTKCYMQNAQLNIIKHKARAWMTKSASVFACACKPEGQSLDYSLQGK